MRQVAIAAVPTILLSLLPAPAHAKPYCYVKDAAGRTINLSAMCRKAVVPVQAAVVTSPPNPTSDKSRFIEIGKVRGRTFFLDTEESSYKNLQINVLTEDQKGLITLDYSFACAERRIFLTGTEYYKDGKLSEASSNQEQGVAPGSLIEKALAMQCRRIGSPGY